MRARRVDSNHKELVEAFRQLGATVTDLSRVGQGCPDILVGYCSISIPVEIKTRTGKLNLLQQQWLENWQGSHAIVRDHEGVIRLIETMRYVAGHGRQ
jgi:hypothetical protein